MRVLMDLIMTTARKEQAEPQRTVKGIATRTEGPRKRYGEPYMHADVVYPLNPLVVCMLRAEMIQS